MRESPPLRILYVLPYAPSPIRVRPYQIIRSLARAGHRVTVVALEDDFANPAAARELKGVCDAVHLVPHPGGHAALNALLALPTPEPLWAAWAKSPAMSRLLRDLMSPSPERFDVAHVEHLRAARFAADLPPSLPRVLDAVDCITELRRQMKDLPGGAPANRLLSWEEWAKLRRWEPRAYRAFARIAVTSSEDRAALLALASPSGDSLGLPPITVVPNGVDTEYFRPLSDVPAQPDHLVFSGKMSYAANEDAARYLLADILPRLRALRPGGVTLTLAGSRPSDRLRSLAAHAGGVTVTGTVDDLRPHLARASVAVCPLRVAVGIQNKALEAMAMALPVVATPLAARALGVEATVSGAVTVTESSDAFAHACAVSRP